MGWLVVLKQRYQETSLDLEIPGVKELRADVLELNRLHIIDLLFDPPKDGGVEFPGLVDRSDVSCLLEDTDPFRRLLQIAPVGMNEAHL